MQGYFQKFWNTFIWSTEERGVNLENPKTPLNGWTLDQVLGTSISSTGRPVSKEGAMTLSAVYRAVAIKAGFISSLPFKVYRKTPSGRMEENSSVARLLSVAPNSKMNKVVFFDRAMQHFELYGNHFAKITRNQIGRVMRIDLVHPDYVTVLEGANDLVYEVQHNGKKEFIESEDMIHVPNMGDGYVGKSVLKYMMEDASLMLDVRGYGANFFGRGGKPVGLLVPRGPVTPQQREEMSKSFQAAKSKGGEVALPSGWDYKEISVPPKEADWVTTNDFSVTNVARWFGIPPQKLGESNVTYSNVEHMAIGFIQDTMQPIASKFENEYTRKLFLLPSEEELYVEFNLDAYVRADSVTKSELLATYIQNALITPNEGRKLDNRPAVEGGDELFIQGATVPLSLQKQLYAPKTSDSAMRKRIAKQVKEGTDPQLILEGLFSNDGKGY